MEINSEIKNRIIATADQLYQAGDREKFPTVDDVRRAARADMNSTSSVMKIWRRQQTAAPESVAVAVPERLQATMSAAMANVWPVAQELANESLDAAKTAWELERAEAEALRAEMSDAYESQALELAEVQKTLSESQAAAQLSSDQNEQQAKALADLTAKLTTAKQNEVNAKQRIDELRSEVDAARAKLEQQAEKHSGELNAARAKLEEQAEKHSGELGAIQKQLDTTTRELQAITVRADEQQKAAGKEQATAKSQADKMAADLEKARNSAIDARERAAGFEGKIEALMAQNAEFLTLIQRPTEQGKAADAAEKTAAAQKRGSGQTQK